MASLKNELEVLRKKMESWKERSKLGIDQHRARIKELSAKLQQCTGEREALMRLNELLGAHVKSSNILLFDSLSIHEKEVCAKGISTTRLFWTKALARQDMYYREKLQEKECECSECRNTIDDLMDQVQNLTEELETIVFQKSRLEEKAKVHSTHESLKESAATREAVALAVAAARENFEAEELAVRIDYDNQINELRLVHEEEVRHVQEELRALRDMLRQRQCGPSHHLDDLSKAAGPTSASVDESYMALFAANQSLESKVASLKSENSILMKKIGDLEAKRKDGLGPSLHSSLIASNTVQTGLPSTLGEAQTVVMELQGREKTLRNSITDLQLQLGSLRENPPLPEGALGAEQKKYLKALVMNLYRSNNKDHLMKSLAPVLAKILDLPELNEAR